MKTLDNFGLDAFDVDAVSINPLLIASVYEVYPEYPKLGFSILKTILQELSIKNDAIVHRGYSGFRMFTDGNLKISTLTHRVFDILVAAGALTDVALTDDRMIAKKEEHNHDANRS